VVEHQRDGSQTELTATDHKDLFLLAFSSTTRRLREFDSIVSERAMENNVALIASGKLFTPVLREHAMWNSMSNASHNVPPERRMTHLGGEKKRFPLKFFSIFSLFFFHDLLIATGFCVRVASMPVNINSRISLCRPIPRPEPSPRAAIGPSHLIVYCWGRVLER
jgi:hypothetical protein